jgi:hypothetical protein
MFILEGHNPIPRVSTWDHTTGVFNIREMGVDVFYDIFIQHNILLGTNKPLNPPFIWKRAFPFEMFCRNYQNNLMPNIHGDRRFRDQTL